MGNYLCLRKSNTTAWLECGWGGERWEVTMESQLGPDHVNIAFTILLARIVFGFFLVCDKKPLED
jgi:hypothetical protein